MAHTYNGKLFTQKREENTDIYYDIDEPGKHTKWKKKTDTKGQILYDSIYIKYLEETNS